MFMEDRVGSLEAGKWADLVILEKNPRATDVDKIAEIKVLETWLGGRQAFVADNGR